MRHILLPTDFSENAQHAIKYAVYLFEKEECIFYILHAHHKDTSLEKNLIEAEDRLNQVTQKLIAEKENPEHRFEPLLIHDSALNAIYATIIDYAIEYVFMGAKGVSGLKEIFMGSVAVSVINLIDFCPIILVPLDYDYDIPDKIIFATDFKHFFKKVELSPLITLIKLWNSKLLIVHIEKEKKLSKNQRDHKELLRKLFKGLPYEFKESRTTSAIAGVINQLNYNTNTIGMIAMMKRKQGFFERLLHESTVKKVAFHSIVPFLVLPEAEE